MPTLDRMLKINELLAQELSQLLEEEAEELGILTIVSVAASRDLSVADVFCVPVAPGALSATLISETLAARASHYRRLLGKRLHLRRIPEFHFHLGKDSADYRQLEQLLDEIKENEAP